MPNLTKKERRRLLDGAYEIEKQHCTGCKGKRLIQSNHKPSNVCGDCPSYQELRSIGKQLSPYDQAETYEPKQIEIPFTWDDYTEWRQDGMRKADVAEMMGITFNQLDRYLKILYQKRRRDEKIRQSQAQKVSGQ